AIRGFGKAAANTYKMQVIGFKNGFEGLVEDKTLDLSGSVLSGILTAGGTILGTSRTIPQQMPEGDKLVDRTDAAINTYTSHKLDALVCIGGKETQKAALHLTRAGLNVVTIPKAADNDVPMTDLTIGFDTAREIATQALDRLHSTANANHRIIIVELLGIHSGWLTMGAGIASGADVILIPEIPYDTDIISQAILKRKQEGKNFSIIAIAENARSKELVTFIKRSQRLNKTLRQGEDQAEVEAQLEEIKKQYTNETMLLGSRLEEATRLTTRVSILGYLLRGGTPSAFDRLLATQMAEFSAAMISKGLFGQMVSYRNGAVGSVPLEEVSGKTKPMPLDHPWITSARQVGTCLGD
ncbi:MAG: ATP-dependent 6-phosphofructokinase, partial [Anaerolineaceae bacterium]|nr:ATP-dependent 6-phosphofructokinase [Anaerolineaceae bacterium]